MTGMFRKNVSRRELALGTGAALIGSITSGAGAVTTNIQGKMRESVSVKDFGAFGDGVTDDTAAILAAHAASKVVDYPQGRYLVTMPNNAALVTFTSQDGVRIIGRGATIYDSRVYTGDPIAPVFDFVGCNDAQVDINYEGALLASPSTNLGYFGGALVRWRNGSKRLKVRATIKNARYGVLSGAYTDFSQGNNKDIEVDIDCTFVGYPVALYWVDGVQIKINADGVHRAAYLAGVSNGTVNAYWKNQYIADLSVICTNAKTSNAPTLKGCENLDILSVDTGSTTFQASSSCCGIANSFQGAAFSYTNLNFRFSVVATDTVSTTVGGFKMQQIGALPDGSTYSWEPTTYIRNITISGVVDRTNQTANNCTASDIRFNSLDTGAHTATVENIRFKDVTIKPSPGSTNNVVIVCTGLQDQITFENFVMPTVVGVSLATAVNTRVLFDRCKINSLMSGGTIGTIEFQSSIFNSVADALTVGGNPLTDSYAAGAGMTLRMKVATLALSGAAATWINAIPSGAVVIGCVSRIQTNITGGTGYLLGVAADTSRWSNVNSLTAGLSTTPANYGTAGLAPQIYQAATSIIVTAKTSNFTGGSLKVVLYYFDTTSPTS